MLRSIKVDTFNGDDENVTDVGGSVAASLHMMGYVAEKVMHPVNEVGGICRARSFSIILWRCIVLKSELKYIKRMRM